MAYECKVIADSVGPNAARITTFQLRMPRFILAQFNTHRAISKNARSSRAVPVKTMIAEVENDPVMPIYWGKNQRGMAATQELDAGDIDFAERHWLVSRDNAVYRARRLMEYGIHKQIANRLLEPFMWADVVATATDWNNFFALRCDKHAQPEIQKIAVMMAKAFRDSVPVKRPARPTDSSESNHWHLPYVTDEERAKHYLGDLMAISVARCGRASYRAFDGSESPLAKDAEFHDNMVNDGHWSPTEHQGAAQPECREYQSGNFLGWTQYRQTLKKSVHESFDFAILQEFGEREFLV